MNFIKNVPHYIYSLYYDLKYFQFVRKAFYPMLFAIGFTWILLLAFPVPILHPILGTILIIILWLILYYRHMYPYVTRLIEEVETEEKYPYFISKFNKKD